MRSFLKYNWPSILWAAFILVICLMPGRHIPRITIPHFDKVVHVSLYLILAVLTYSGWVRQEVYGALHRQTAIKVVLLLAIYGFVIEVMQGTLTVDRSFDLYDALANSAGAAIGAFGTRMWSDRKA